MRKADSNRQAPTGWLRRLRTELLPLLIMLLLLTAARSSLANHYQVPSGSMENTLMPGDRVVVDMMAYGLRVPFTDFELLARGKPQAGDVAVFDSPADGVRLIKRVVAVEGDTVELVQGRLSVNGSPLGSATDPQREIFGYRIVALNLDRGGGPDLPPVVVPEGQVLVLGDHRGDSLDGRYFGWVAADSIYGKALAVYYRRQQGFGWNTL